MFNVNDKATWQGKPVTVVETFFRPGGNKTVVQFSDGQYLAVNTSGLKPAPKES
jgi:hypothetical protein